jgi:hydroxyacylglutathione hydrolase
MKMNLEIIKSEGLSHNSYFLSDENEAVVIDPRRDCKIYTQLARRNCSHIKYILETHRNEDFVIGSLELQNVCEAEIAHSKELNFKYGEHNLTNGDTLTVGNIKIKSVSTPGHTNESLCYIVYIPGSSEPIMVFAGDTLFSGSVGRTDLLGKPNQLAQAKALLAT